MGKYERTPVPQDELMDEELLALGVKFTDRTGEVPEDTESDEYAEEAAVKPEKPRKLGRMMSSFCSLVAADSLLIFMCLANKIELGYGLVFLAAASAILGGRVNHASL